MGFLANLESKDRHKSVFHVAAVSSLRVLLRSEYPDPAVAVLDCSLNAWMLDNRGCSPRPQLVGKSTLHLLGETAVELFGSRPPSAFTVPRQHHGSN